MPRIVKDADVRRDELLDTALALFLERGYEHTSVEHITTAVGVAKGTFYHYFATKQDLLEQLVARFTDDVFAEAEAALDRFDGSALDKLRGFVVAGSSAKLGRRDEALMLTRPLFAEGNEALLRGLIEGWIARTRPLMRAIVDQGCAEGIFDVPDARATTEIWLSLWFDHGTRLSRLYFAAQDDPARIEEIVAAADALEVAEERILGLSSGGLGLHMGDTMRAVFGASSD